MSIPVLKTFLQGSFVSILGVGIVGVLNYLVRRHLSLTLSENDYGCFYSAFALLMMIFGFCDLGMTQSGNALIAENAKCAKRNDCFSVLIFFKGILSLIIFCGIVLTAGWISRSYLNINTSLPLMILSVLFVFKTVNSSFQAWGNGLKLFGTNQAFQVFESILLLSGVIILADGYKLNGVTLTFLVASFSIAILQFFYYSKFFHLRIVVNFDHAIARKLFHLCGWVAISTTLLTTVYYMDTVMLTAMKGVESSAKYNIALPIMQIVQALMIFPAIFLPLAIDLVNNQDYAKLQSFAKVAVGITVILAPITYIFFDWSGGWLIKVLFSAKYQEAAPAVALLCSGLIFFTLGNFLFQILLGLGKTREMAIIAGIVAVCNIILNFFLIRRWDFLGAAGATLASYLIMAVITTIVLYFCLKTLNCNNRNKMGIVPF